MTTENLQKHQQDYRAGAWEEYTDEELMWWVRLLKTRAEHRTNEAKKAKDLYDASNYQAMLDSRYPCGTVGCLMKAIHTGPHAFQRPGHTRSCQFNFDGKTCDGGCAEYSAKGQV